MSDGQARAHHVTPDFAEELAEKAAAKKNGIPHGQPADLAIWPDPIGQAAKYGLAWRYVSLIAPHTEADENFLLILFLAYVGNYFGRDAYVIAGGDRHYANLFVCAVGSTSEGRKGSATGPIEMFFRGIDDDWLSSNHHSGLSTGEGLIWCVRDPVVKREKTKGRKKGEAQAYEEVTADPGISDKRVVIRQSEFHGALQAMKRQGNTLSATMRDAWDRGNITSITKNSPAKATGAHITIIGNITGEELKRSMLQEDLDNGFANRFAWACSRRSKVLPEGGRMREVGESEEFQEIQRQFNRISLSIKGEVKRNPEASDIWGYNDQPDGAYRHLTRAREGLFGIATARAAPIVLRLSLIYALLDGSQEIRREHMEAALEIWRYCEDSAKFIFGNALADPIAEAIVSALRAHPEGMTRTEIRNVFNRNQKADVINRALDYLQRIGMARMEPEKTDGRPTERWFYVSD